MTRRLLAALATAFVIYGGCFYAATTVSGSSYTITVGDGGAGAPGIVIIRYVYSGF